MKTITAEGPWNDEPDLEDFEHAGLACRILRSDSSGALCGYVRIPERHPLHGIESSALIPEALKAAGQSVMGGAIGKRGIVSLLIADPDAMRVDLLFDVHGSLTFSGELHGVPGYWYGFDCAHHLDLAPVSIWRGYSEADDVYRDIEYVRGECRSLAEQLIKLGDPQAREA